MGKIIPNYIRWHRSSQIVLILEEKAFLLLSQYQTLTYAICKHGRIFSKNQPTPGDVYSAMCLDGCLCRYPNTIQLFKFTLLILSTTSEVESGFSTMNLLVLPIRISLNDANVDSYVDSQCSCYLKLKGKSTHLLIFIDAFRSMLTLFSAVPFPVQLFYVTSNLCYLLQSTFRSLMIQVAVSLV